MSQTLNDSFNKLCKIVEELRQKCPWDRKQTMSTLQEMTLEEVYELAEAILKQDRCAIREELGDVLLHVIFYSRIATEKQWFDIQEVIESLCSKLIERHPHVYKNQEPINREEVEANWEAIKDKKKKGLFFGVPKALPALIKAMRIQEKARHVGFDWPKPEEVIEKLQEEISEFQEAQKSKSKSKVEEEFGDILFSIINYARFIDVNPEQALQKTNQKFMQRFAIMEELTTEKKQKFQDLTLEQMEALWQKAKQILENK